MSHPRTHRPPVRAGWPAGVGRPVLTGRGALVMLLAAALVALGLTFGLRGLAGEKASVSDRLRALFERADGPLVVYSAFGEGSDAFFAADPDNPSDRVRLGGSAHAPGYGVAPALSPDGRYLAYAALPPDAEGHALQTNADLWLLNVANGNAIRLTTGVDLLVPPVWSPAGDALVARRGEWLEGGGAHFELLRIDLRGTSSRLVSAPADLFPIGFSPDGAWLYYAALNENGTVLERIASAGGAPERLARLSEGVARDWQLSPDGARLAYLAQAPAGAADPFDLRVLDLRTGAVQAPADDTEPVFNPRWEPDGALTFGRASAGGAAVTLDLTSGRRASSTLRFAAPVAGAVDVPLSWSPAGDRLAVRTVETTAAGEPGPSRVMVLGTDGSRRPLADQGDIAIAGWLEGAP